ncbi:MAG: hypothetical protein ABIX01_07575 [Chitinophagaceae bacterium]
MINESEAAFNTTAPILLPGTLDTAQNRTLMPEADFLEWTSPEMVAIAIQQVIEGQETGTVIHF